MKCCDCGKEMRLLSGYAVTDKNVGTIETDGEYWECTNPACGCKLVPAATVGKVDVIRAERTERLLWSLTGSPKEFDRRFIRVKEVAAILGVSRQAVEKSPFVKGLTYNIVMFGIRYWLKESVERYKKTGDGRFPLPSPAIAPASLGTGAWLKPTGGRRKATTATSPVLTPAD